VQHEYLNTVKLLERLHRQFLEVIKCELEKRAIGDINSVQCLILFNIGFEEITIGELTYRGYYLGSNVSYNAKKMAEANYIEQNRSAHDKRSIRVKLTDKGKKLCEILQNIFEFHSEKIKEQGVTVEEFNFVAASLKKLEKFWSDAVHY
jgi:DNA-binding MarR family transcriptional regulator